MKKLITVLFLIAINVTFSQNGKVYPKNSEIKSGGENTYIYEPQKGLSLPENILVNVVYKEFNKKSVPLIKKENNYEFSLKVPDYIDVVILTISDKKQNVLDSNLGKGYAVYLKNKTNEEIESAMLSKLELFDAVNYLLKLSITPEENITRHETLFAQNPALKNKDSYGHYLYLKFRINKEETKPEMIDFAKKLINRGDDKGLTKAYYIYSTLKMGDEMNELEKTAINKYPKGQLAKNKFFSKFYGNKDKTDTYVLEALKDYSAKFNDNSQKAKDQFYTVLVSVYLKKKDTLNLNKYENLITDKIGLAGIYNSFAWDLSGQDLLSPGNDLKYAATLSKKTVEIAKNRMLNPKENETSNQFQGMYNTFVDTYALILYKQEKYGLAFKYQDEIAKRNGLDTGGKERYAASAEKVKEPEFVKNYLEEQLIGGVDSRVMVNQLQKIYKKLGLPENEFEKIKGNSLKLATQKTKEDLIKIYGDIKGIDFTLTNLKGQKVKLSDYKGKVLVLDFWATWCAPCRVSFPKMQKLVNKYKNDNIEFFFINTWERNEPNQIMKNVSKFLKDKNYSFNVLFDYEDEVAAKYKIKGIPAKIVIDKNGSILLINSSDDNLEALIDENIK